MAEPIPDPKAAAPSFTPTRRLEPWQWGMVAVVGFMAVLVAINPNFREAYDEIVPQGIWLT
ncbi:MAG: hypothetical protein HKN46_00335, partial [Acidimicrobiia bacterium]|nr:hypothetical protein [Acidimicrobiia bacterium]